MEDDIYFSGTLEEAQKQAQNTKKLVTVILQGGSEETFRLHAETLENSEIKRCLQATSITLLIDDDSAEGGSFKKTYSPSTIPCIYILLNGFPVSAMQGFVGPEELKSKLETAYQAVNQVSGGSSAQQDSAGASAALTPEEVEAHKQRIKEKLKQLREKKSKQEEEDELAREKKRREDGKLMLESQQRLKEAKEQREREIEAKKKEEDRKYQERLREQIRLEKLERQQKLAANSSSTAAAQSTSPSGSRKSDSTCMIRVRLFSGELASQSFPANEKLAAVREWIASLTMKIKFVMSTNYPAKVFSAADMSKTLSELGLVPSANIIISETDPSASLQSIATSRSSSSNSSQFTSSGGSWFSSTWSAVSNFVWTFLSAPSAPSAQPTDASQSQSSTSTEQKQSGAPTSSMRVVEGNIHGLSSSSPQEDPKKKDKFYWNGNSTQFS